MFRFEIQNGSDAEIEIRGDYFDSEQVAQERATSEFVDGSYTTEYVEFSTYLTHLVVGNIVSVRGKPYKIISIGIDADATKITNRVKGERYEN